MSYGGDSSPASPYIIKKIKPSLNLQLQRRNSKEGSFNSPHAINQALKQTSPKTGGHKPNYTKFTKTNKLSPKIINVD